MAPPAPSSGWPWDKLGSYKYLLYAPLAVRVACSRPWEGGVAHPADLWLLHVLVLTSLRLLAHSLCCSAGNMLWLTRNRRIVKEGVDFKQIDFEWHWDNFAILDAVVAASATPLVSRLEMPVWNWSGLVPALLVHIFVSEPLFYWVHREVHRSDGSSKLYARFHSAHHAAPVPQAPTAAFGSPTERLFLCAVMAMPLVGAALAGTVSLALVYAYVLSFDLLRCLALCNVEVVPHRLFGAVPALRYIVSTPTYHALHHSDKASNFCLFMPVFDYLGGTVHPDSWDRHREISSATSSKVPDFVFLAHVVDMAASMHAPFVHRGFSALPYTTRLFMLPVWPVALVSMVLMWIYSKVFLVSFYNLRGRLHQTWAVPRFGFQYFLPFAKDGINDQIEQAILRADRIGVEVISLAALNKNEALNGGGTLFVKKHPDLRVRVVHGNTLTAAVILHGIPEDTDEVFLTGSTSKLGRAIALYLCRKKVRVLMMTLSTERFLRIKKEAPAEFQQYLVQVTKYQAAQHCKTWVVGKWLSPTEQGWAPPGTHFHQFVVPPMIGFRRDCTYGSLAAMRLPEDVEGLGICEYTLQRGVVHACHAGGVVHFLEGYQHHEVGAIDVDRIDVVWEAALRHGLRPA